LNFLDDSDEDVILIGAGLAEELGVGIGDRITLSGMGKNESLRQRTMTIVSLFSLGLADAEKGLVFYKTGGGRQPVQPARSSH